jgi:hypothetical protein
MKKLIITEGADDQKFFKGLLSYLKITDIEVEAIGGKNGRGSKSNIFDIDDIRGVITAKTEELPSKILITCDADFAEEDGDFDGFEKTNKATEKILRDLKKKEKNKIIGFFIIPNNASDGNLESLYLDSCSLDRNLFGCVEAYLNCLSEKISLKQNPKIKALSLLAPIGLKDDVYKAGYAAFDERKKSYREGYWNFESPTLASLKDFLEQFFKN